WSRGPEMRSPSRRNSARSVSPAKAVTTFFARKCIDGGRGRTTFIGPRLGYSGAGGALACCGAGSIFVAQCQRRMDRLAQGFWVRNPHFRFVSCLLGFRGQFDGAVFAFPERAESGRALYSHLLLAP